MGRTRIQSRLDAELGAFQQLGTRARLSSLNLNELRTLRAAGPPPPPPTVDVKLIVRPGDELAATAWLGAVDAESKVASSDGSVLLVTLPATKVAELQGAAWLLRAEAARELQPLMDVAASVVGLRNAAGDYPKLDGSGVVLGIVDTGVDWKHADFRDANGSRIEMFAFARRPPGIDSSTYSVFSKADLDELNPAVPDGDRNGHGTHCAGIAVGGHPRFRGVAPGATLMAVRSEPLLDTHTIWGIGEMFRRAGDRPCVVSLSLGSHFGAHDGTSALEQFIARESGPGRIVVVAAGNEAAKGMHWSGQLATGDAASIGIRSAGQQLQSVDVWLPRGDDIDVTIETPDGARYEPDGAIHETVFGAFRADLREDPINRDGNLTLLMLGAGANHVWKVNLKGEAVLDGRVHAWAAEPQTLLNPSALPNYSIGMPATADRAIAVASFVSKSSIEQHDKTVLETSLVAGELSPFSSQGPTRHGSQKPDVAAPGQYITAALAVDSQFASEPQHEPRIHPDGTHITIQGTSMATPFVAGVVAHMLQREPKLTPEEILRRIRATAKRDASTGPVWNAGFGWGKLDVAELLRYRG
jgi:subtilisin family serine protease